VRDFSYNHIHPLSCRYEGLGVKEIKAFLDENHPEVYQWLPEPELELPKTPKAYIANVCATVLEDKFSKWVKAQTDLRHQKVAVQKDVMIELDPEMAKIFHQSAAVSSKYEYRPLTLIMSITYSDQGHLGPAAPEG